MTSEIKVSVKLPTRRIKTESTDAFLDRDGNITSDPGDPEAPFPILCGDWPNPHPEAIRVACRICNAPLGISAKGLAFHQQLPDGRPMLCRDCFYEFTAAVEVELQRQRGES